MCGRKPATFCRLLMRAFTYIVSWISEDSLLKKILTRAWCYYTPKVDTKFLQDRSLISINRKGVTAFAVFLLSIFKERRKLFLSGVGCRSPPSYLDFYISKIQMGGTYGEVCTKKSIYQRKWQLCGTVL